MSRSIIERPLEQSMDTMLRNQRVVYYRTTVELQKIFGMGGCGTGLLSIKQSCENKNLMFLPEDKNIRLK